MKNLFFTVAIFLFWSLVLSPNTTIFAQETDLEGWELYQQKTELKIYTRPNPDTDIKEVRIITTMKTTIPSLMAALNDVEAYTEWVYKCQQPKKLQVNSPQEFYYYTQTDLPFPVSDRDLVVISKQWKDEATGVVYSHSIAKPDFIPHKDDVVRIENFESYWKITPKQEDRVYIDYQVKTDPGGNIPVWIINLGIASGPIKTMEKLAAIVQQPKYKNAETLTYLQ